MSIGDFLSTMNHSFVSLGLLFGKSLQLEEISLKKHISRCPRLQNRTISVLWILQSWILINIVHYTLYINQSCLLLFVSTSWEMVWGSRGFLRIREAGVSRLMDSPKPLPYYQDLIWRGNMTLLSFAPPRRSSRDWKSSEK